MVRKRNVGDLNILVRIDPNRFQVDRQLRVLENGGDTRAVVEMLAAETIGAPADVIEKTG